MEWNDKCVPYLKYCDETGNRVYNIDHQLDDMRLQNAQMSVVGLLDEHEEENERDDADDEQEDATEETFVGFRAVDLRTSHSRCVIDEIDEY